MTFASWLRRLQRGPASRRKQARPAAPRVRPRVEALEERAVPASTLTWSHNFFDPFLNTNWSAGRNWSPGNFPHTGDNLIFPNNSFLGRVSTNDLFGISLNSIRFEGKALDGD